jgi:hypothetical protein
MSIEGGDFQCYVHDFKTSIVKEWNNHCVSKDCGREEGTTACRDCGKQIKFKNLPFHPFDEQGHKNISLQCPGCSDRFSNVEMEVLQ